MVQSRVSKAIPLLLALCSAALGQLNQNCTVSVLNRNVQVNADGSWVLPNVPANVGQVKARATCVQNGVTTSGESAFFIVPANDAVNLPVITLGSNSQIPVSLAIAPATISLTAAGQTLQLTITGKYPDSSTKDLTATNTGTTYTSSNSAIATVSANGLLTAIATGTVLIQATNDGAFGIVAAHVFLGGTSHGGIPDTWAIANSLDPTDPTMPLQDPDRDGLTNLQEFQLGTNPNNPDTDGDGLTDGDEVNKYHTNPLLADTDGDLIPDGVEIQTGTDPLNAASYDLAKATATSVVRPAAFTLTTNALSPNASQQLSWQVTLIDGKTTLDLTADPRTNYSSDNLAICNFGGRQGLVFAGGAGSCIITLRHNNLSAAASGAVQSFAPTALSYLAIPGFANNVKPSGNYAYVAAGAAGLQVVDVADRTKPAIVASLALAANANDLRIVGRTLYMAAGSGLLIIDIANPLAPRLIGSLSTPDAAWDVVIRDNLAYIAAGTAGLRIANVANPASPALVGSLAIAGGTAKGVDIAGNYAVVAASGAGVVIVNIANPAAPQLLGSVVTPGDPRKVAVKGTAAFVADYPESMQVVDFSNPGAPAIVATTDPSLGGRLQDIALTEFSGGTFTLGADVFFVNGVPIVDVTQPRAPTPRAILNFSQFRDDNGHGIGLDSAYVYITAEQGTITDLGTTGDTRLYIGQYQQIVDNGGVAPSVQITTPAAGTTLIQGATITVTAFATDDVAVASVTFLVNNQAVFTGTASPYQFSYTVPLGVTSLVFGATAIDYGSNIGTAPNVQVAVIPDPGTTATGQVVDSNGFPVTGATVTVGLHSSTTASDGSFSIPQVPTVVGDIQVLATFRTPSGATLAGLSNPFPPVTLGITNVGKITVLPVPVITSLSRKSALADSQVTMQVAGTTLAGATFEFRPVVSPPIAVQIASTSPDGTSATLTLTVPASAIGTFATVVSNVAGTSNTNVTPVDRFTVVDPNSTTDTDGDGFQDVIEGVFGTDPLDLSSFPVIPAATETESIAFSVLNAPVTGSGSQETESVAFSVMNAPVTGSGSQETESVAFSVMNAPVTGSGSQETESVAFSVMNAPVTGSGSQETESVAFSVMNAPVTGSGSQETESVSFSVLNTFTGLSNTPLSANSQPRTAAEPSPVNHSDTPLPTDPFLDSDADGLPDWFELLIGTDPFNPDTDGDGLTDFEEVFIYHTNPLIPDTDGDGFNDGVEILFGSDPLNRDSTPRSVGRRAGMVLPGVNGLKTVADDSGIKKNTIIKGDAHVKERSRKPSRGQAAVDGAVSGSLVPN